MLFVGREWERKGADTGAGNLRAPARGRVCGRAWTWSASTSHRCALPAWVRNHGLLDKRNPAQRARLEALFAQSHFFFVPSQAENYGMAFCEAAAYGLPSLTTAAGGIPTIVRHGKTGYTLAPQAPPATGQRACAQAIDNPDAYRAMAAASHADFCARLNWRAFGARLRDILERGR